jgi:hypothetical protein
MQRSAGAAGGAFGFSCGYKSWARNARSTNK